MQTHRSAWRTALAACATLLCAAHAAHAQTPTSSPQLGYQSAFSDYRPYRDAPRANWRELNDRVAAAPGGTGGHAGHAGHAGHMMGAAKPAPASAAKPGHAAPHHGHGMHGGKP